MLLQCNKFVQNSCKFRSVSLRRQEVRRLAAHDAMHQPINPEAAAQGPLPSAAAMPWAASAPFKSTAPTDASPLTSAPPHAAAVGTAVAAPTTQWTPSSPLTWQISRPVMLVSDLDDTFVGQDPAADAQTAKLGVVWQEARARGMPCKLVYNTGRTMPLYQQLWAAKQHVMPVPDVFIGGVGTEVYHWTGNGFQLDLTWQQQLQQGWSLAAVQSVVEQLMQQYSQVRVAPHLEQSPFKLTFFYPQQLYPDVLQRLQQLLQAAGVTPVVVEGGADNPIRYVDLLPPCAGKGGALAYVAQQLGYEPSAVVACGDSSNDIQMLERAQLGVLVANANLDATTWAATYTQRLHPQGKVLYRAGASRAEGILEALAALGFLVPGGV